MDMFPTEDQCLIDAFVKAVKVTLKFSFDESEVRKSFSADFSERVATNMTKFSREDAFFPHAKFTQVVSVTSGVCVSVCVDN